jgi:hypothetical protein
LAVTVQTLVIAVLQAATVMRNRFKEGVTVPTATLGQKLIGTTIVPRKVPDVVVITPDGARQVYTPEEAVQQMVNWGFASNEVDEWRRKYYDSATRSSAMTTFVAAYNGANPRPSRATKKRGGTVAALKRAVPAYQFMIRGLKEAGIEVPTGIVEDVGYLQTLTPGAVRSPEQARTDTAVATRVKSWYNSMATNPDNPEGNDIAKRWNKTISSGGAVPPQRRAVPRGVRPVVEEVVPLGEEEEGSFTPVLAESEPLTTEQLMAELSPDL